MKDLPYRPAVGIMLLNREGKVFVGQRIDSTAEAWQMPQGGIDKGEEPGAAVRRELEEETGIAPDLVEIIAEAPKQLDYDLPDDLVAKLWKGKYRGQRQTWYLARYLGTDDQIDLATEHPEFNAWRWVAPDQLPELIVPFKRKLYEAVLASFVSELARG
ncbi:putative (di)nucleoside polyphosphate hydrolase [Sphingomonas vulcanisoli]|uniref:RNA pyrophosphohydrolase n=1 Tax=Sphingomonas vulcanisoli TaxID=1658060 RepID=A0ABX0TUH8_9SPHN|nr:RNA pyrophosphohydrolase [Sphingomonas vulcanisoli]NIJ08369.1 putative (di)nucleoside polyphosphate hydrolase [Sphingomonas vulcanisoli]